MRFILLAILAAECLFFGAQLLTAHFHFTPHWLPYNVSLKNKKLIDLQNEKIKFTQNAFGQSGNSLERFHSMRKTQLKKLEDIEKQHPANARSKSKQLLPSGPASSSEAWNYLLRCYYYFDPKIGLLWFEAEMITPLWLRVLFWAPLLIIPVLIFSNLKKIIKKPQGEYQRFLRLKHKNPRLALSLWQQQGIESQFKLENRKIKIQWLKELIKLQEVDNSLEWGTYLLNDDRNDLKFRHLFCQKILIDMHILDLKYSWIFDWYIQSTQNTNLAETLWTKVFLIRKFDKLEPEVLRLVKTIQKLHPNQEIEDFAEHHEMILNGPDADSSFIA